MPKIKRVCKFLFLIIILSLLSSCWDKEELESKAYVIGLGIDRSKNDGEIKVTMLIANPEVGSMQGGGGSIEKPREIITFDDNDLLTAKSTANAIISRNISYELLKVLIVSEEFAKDPHFIPILNDVLKDKEIRMNSYLAISKEKAYDYFLKNRPKLETRPHKYFEYMINHGIENGFIPDSTLFRFFKSIDEGNDLALAMYTTTERERGANGGNEYIAGELKVTGELDDTEFIGAAVFKQGKMIGKLSGVETRVINILDDTANIEDILISFPNPFGDTKQKMSARILKTDKNKVKMNVKSVNPKIQITVPLQIEILSNPSLVNFLDERNQQMVKQQLTDYIKMNIEEVIIRSQTELKGIPFPLSLYARKYFRTIPEYEKFNWPNAYLRADVDIVVDTHIIDFGIKSKKPKR